MILVGRENLDTRLIRVNQMGEPRRFTFTDHNGECGSLDSPFTPVVLGEKVEKAHSIGEPTSGVDSFSDQVGQIIYSKIIWDLCACCEPHR